ncbi:hypothetical protein CEQ90_08580 [Lewinellaceae bacterium SD302]|nr:hypothetical protein CEQ90_08580 [Lewinellaceae bacterium SD302]
MKLLPFLFTILSFLACNNRVVGQLDNLAEQSDVIITGEVISSAASWNIERTRIYTTHQIQIDHIYKGFVDDAIVSIRTIGGEVDDLFQFMTHTVELHPGQFGYAFLRKIPDSNVYELYHTESFYEVSYETEGNLIIDGEVLRPVQFDRAIISSTKQRPQTFAENVRYRTSGLGLTEYSCSNTSEGAVTLELKFDNVTISSDLSFLEFDIFAKSSMPGIQFGKGNIFLNYSTEFGTSVVQNGTADISKSEVIQDTVYALSYSDVGQQNLALNIGRCITCKDRLFSVFSI